MAGYDAGRYDAVLRWPLHELLIAYVEQMKAEALDAYRHATLVYCLQAPHQKKPGKPPRVPSILK